jgi:hypothetical protein
MSGMPPIEPRWAWRVWRSRVWLVIMAMQIALGAVLLVGFSFTQLLAWARSPAGLNHELGALVIVFWLGITPQCWRFRPDTPGGTAITPGRRSSPHGW